MGVGIKDIAQAAGVSPATVSLVLNNRPGVGDTTRKKVIAIARSMEYDLDRSHNLSQGSSKTILFLRVSRHGHVINDDHAVFIANYIDGLSKTAKQLNLNLEIQTLIDGPIETVVEAVQAPHVSGCIILGTEMNAEEIQAFSKVQAPIVFIDNFSEIQGFSFIDMNNAESVDKAVECLVRAGHSQIGIVTSNVTTPNFQMRTGAFKEALESRGLSYKKEYTFIVDSTVSGAYEDMKTYLQSGRALPTAFFCANDIMAYGTIRALKAAGMRIPQDVSIVGFDNLPSSSIIDPPLTTIDVPKSLIGEYAVRVLDQKIQAGGSVPDVKILISGDLVSRASVRTFPTGEQASC